jgi:nucleotide-binding universal stress UspA family protein
MYGKILTPLDGSSFSESALSHAVEIARSTGAELLLLRVVQDPLAAVPEAAVGAKPRAIYKRAISAYRYLQGLTARLGGEGIKIRTKVLEGDPAATILCYAHRENVDAIVMGTHGRSGLSRMFWGSVAEKVALTTRRPVVLVKPDKGFRQIPKGETKIEAA